MTDVKDASPAPDEALQEVVAPRDAFRIALPNFEGPLDLLLHLIREHKVDIHDIPIAHITEKYLEHLELMKEINLDIAGEFLVMAATLLHLKSRMLLPREEAAAAAEGADAPVDTLDPRAELVRRLLEYQKYRHAAEQLAKNDLLDREVFARKVTHEEVPLDPGEVGLKEVSVYKLIEALDRVLANLDPKKQHEVTREHLSMSDAMQAVAAKLGPVGSEPTSFMSLFEGQRVRGRIVMTFLALLEMCKMRLVRVFQNEGLDDIFITAREALASFTLPAEEELERDYQ